MGIVKQLLKQFELPFLKAEKESLSQFRFARIMNNDYEYLKEIEQNLDREFNKISETHSWFNFKKLAAHEANSLFSALSLDLEKNTSTRDSNKTTHP